MTVTSAQIAYETAARFGKRSSARHTDFADAFKTWLDATITDTNTVTNKALTSNVATLTIGAHVFDVGDSVTVAGVDATFNGTKTLTAVTATTISYSQTAADVASTASSGTVTGATDTSLDQAYAALRAAVAQANLGWTPAQVLAKADAHLLVIAASYA